MRPSRAVALGILLIGAPHLCADTLKLRDGNKITGTIVGFENGMFRVETEYGFVLVRKEKISSIELSSGEAVEKKTTEAKQEQTKAEAHGAGQKKPDAAPASQLAADPSPIPKESSPPVSAVAKSATPITVAPPAPPPPPKPVSHPLDVPLPAHIDEHVDGNTYVNDTFHFVMYKPPDWRIYEELHREKVSAVVALASEDEQTVLFVDRQVWSGTPDLKNDSVESKLRQSYENYKMISESNTQVDGHPAIRRRFDGVMDGVEWHGVAVRVAEGSTVFGIIGLTSAETFQFQESVFNKIVNSFHVTAEVSHRAPFDPGQ